MFKIANACAQALLAWVLTWIVVGALLLLYGTNSAGAGVVIIDIISEFPVFNVWVKLLGSYTIGRSNPELVATLTALAYANAFVDSIFVGLVVHIVKSLKRRNTVNILSTYFGVLLSMAIIYLFKTSGEFSGLLIELGTIGIMLMGIKILLSGKILSKIFDLSELWTIFVDSIYGVMICGYITKIIMLPTSSAIDAMMWLVEVIVFSIVIVIAGYIAYLITGKRTI